MLRVTDSSLRTLQCKSKRKLGVLDDALLRGGTAVERLPPRATLNVLLDARPRKHRLIPLGQKRELGEHVGVEVLHRVHEVQQHKLGKRGLLATGANERSASVSSCREDTICNTYVVVHEVAVAAGGLGQDVLELAQALGRDLGDELRQLLGRIVAGVDRLEVGRVDVLKLARHHVDNHILVRVAFASVP